MDESSKNIMIETAQAYYESPEGQQRLSDLIDKAIEKHLAEHPDETREEVIERLIKRVEWRANHPVKSSE